MSLRPSPEFRLLADCSVWPLSESRCDAIRQTSSLVDWSRTLALADRHRVGGLLWTALNQANAQVPSETSKALSAKAGRLVRQNLTYAAEALRLQAVFQQAEIPVLFVKGASLAQLAYGTLASRHAKDIDLLVPPAHVERALEVLEQNGYLRTFPPRDLRPDLLRRYLEHGKECRFIDELRRTEVELHWRLADNPTVLSTPLSAMEARLVPIGGSAGLRTLGREDLFAYLCLHGAMHGWNRLKWLADIGSLLTSESEDTTIQLFAAMQDRRVAYPAAQAFLLCHRLFATPIPASLLARLRSHWRLRALEWVALRSMIGGANAQIADRPFGNTIIILAAFLLGDGWRYWAAEARLHLTNFEDVIDCPLPSRLFALYPLLRLPLWIVRHLRTLRRTLARLWKPRFAGRR